jgi:protease I
MCIREGCALKDHSCQRRNADLAGRNSADRSTPHVLGKQRSMLARFTAVGCQVLVSSNVYEDLGYKLRLQEAGAEVVVAGRRGRNMLASMVTVRVGCDRVEKRSIQWSCTRWLHADKLRRDDRVLELVRDFFHAGKPVAAICHGGWIPISAGIYRGVRVTGSPGIKDDLINAGAIWEDAAVVVDRNSVSSRKPDDLPDFCRALIKLMIATSLPRAISKF